MLINMECVYCMYMLVRSIILHTPYIVCKGMSVLCICVWRLPTADGVEGTEYVGR